MEIHHNNGTIAKDYHLTGLRALVNTAHKHGALRASDCRIALDLAAAGITPEQVINYVNLMTNAVSKKRQPREPK